ncbi:MAG: hypothetical protein FK733_04205 [Asgard group archaeon]|nr:hypothetical protein [Asgard group archaeon]
MLELQKNSSKLLFIIVLIFISNFIVTSTDSREFTTDDIIQGNITNKVGTKDTADWLLMVYLNGDIFNEFSAVDALNELEAGFDNTTGIEVIVMIDRIPGYDQSCEDFTTARYYRLQPDDDYMEIGSTLLEEKYEYNMGDWATLQMFVNYAMNNYDANRHALIIQGYGMYLTGLSYDETNYGGITINQIQIALAGRYLDLIILDALEMGWLEVAYELRTRTNYVAFSQNPLQTESYDYEAALEALCINPTMTPVELGNAFGQTYLDFFEYPTYQTFSVINCSALDPLVLAINNLSNALIPIIPAEADNLQMLCLNITSSFMYTDIGVLIEELNNTYSGNMDIVNACNEVDSAYKDVVLNNFVSQYSSERTGLSIYFPPDDELYFFWNYYFNRTYPSYTILGLDFIEVSTWDDFLKWYIANTTTVDIAPPPTDTLELNTIEVLEIDEFDTNVYNFTVTEPGIYNFTLQIDDGDLDFVILNDPSIPIIDSTNTHSIMKNPEQGNYEHIVHWMTPGTCRVIVGSWENSSGSLWVTRIEPKELLLNQAITGNFLPADGIEAPSTVYHYYDMDLARGDYIVSIFISYPVGLEVTIIAEDGSYIVDTDYHINGEDFIYNLQLEYQQKILIGFGSYSGTGAFRLQVEIHTTSTSMASLTIIPLSLIIIAALSIRLKSTKNSK